MQAPKRASAPWRGTAAMGDSQQVADQDEDLMFESYESDAPPEAGDGVAQSVSLMRSDRTYQRSTRPANDGALREMAMNVQALLAGQRRAEKLLDRLARTRPTVAVASDDDLGLPARFSTQSMDVSSMNATSEGVADEDADRSPAAMRMGPILSHQLGRSTSGMVGQESRLGVGEDEHVASGLPDWFLNLQVHDQIHCGIDLDMIQKFTQTSSTGRLLTCDLNKRENPRVLSRSGSRQFFFDADAHRHRPARFVLKPSSQLRLALDILSMVVLAHDAATIPFLLAFEVQHAGAVLWLSCLSAAFWTTDMLVQFRTGYYQDGELEMRPSQISRNYLRSWFLLDFAVLVLDAA
ncbi:unnamed protein product, partial [Prorocentrum cordatum]